MSLIRKLLEKKEGKFIVIGGSIFLASQIALYFFVEFLNQDIILVNLFTQIIALECSFILNTKYTWADAAGSVFKQYVLFHIARIVVFGLNQILFIAFEYIGMPYMLINFIIMGIEAFLNFQAGEKVVFRK